MRHGINNCSSERIDTPTKREASDPSYVATLCAAKVIRIVAAHVGAIFTCAVAKAVPSPWELCLMWPLASILMNTS